MCKFAENFKSLRLKHQFTIKYIAQLLNVSPSTIIAWEKSKSYPYFDTLIKIVKLFNVTCNYILGL